MNRYQAVFTGAVCLGLAACSLGGPTRPSQFYVLSPDDSQPVAARAASVEPLSVSLGPVELPDIVNRPQIVTRTDTHRIDLAEFDRWGGDINEDLVRVLSQNLMGRLNTHDVMAFPWQRRDRPDYQVSVRFFRFDGELGKQVTLTGVWQLLDGSDGCQLQVRRFVISEAPEGGAYADLVHAMSTGVARLADEIAVAVAAARPGCPRS